jgi:[ribosomal protein S5]-alanine N-acetyltransferase
MSNDMHKAFLVGERVYLRPFEREDIKGPYGNWIHDAKVTEHLTAGAFPYSDDELESYFERHINNRNAIFFSVVDKKSGKHIGNARLHSIDWVDRKATRGIMIGDRSVWGQGLGLEVINLLSAYAFERLNLNKLKSFTLVENIGVRKVNERAGYKIEGEARDEFFSKGKYHDVLYWGLLRSDYFKNKQDGVNSQNYQAA